MCPISCPLPPGPAVDHYWTGEIQEDSLVKELELGPELLSGQGSGQVLGGEQPEQRLGGAVLLEWE